MAEEKNQQEEKNEIKLSLEEAVDQLLIEKKAAGSIHYDELTKQIAAPYSLDADGIDQLIQTIEDKGIAVVGDDGGPTKQQMVRAEAAQAEETMTASPVSYTHLTLPTKA